MQGDGRDSEWHYRGRPAPMRILCLAAASMLGLGCGREAAPTVFESHHESPNHSHERGKMMLVDAGPYHAGLTAHLSKKDGNELDVLFETSNETPQPVPLPLTKLTGTATRQGDDKAYPLDFEPAPRNERANDPDGKCSHFTALAHWMRHEDVLTVTLTVLLDGRETKVVWMGFNPKKFAHADE